ncbi:hypothetical protein BJV82DRAFT_665026 [Fennellomyces sp. T-0311]|nr:hypothetical protein BJV82DRAFT_665026 [Fennellomyces sp. T-0311]
MLNPATYSAYTSILFDIYATCLLFNGIPPIVVLVVVILGTFSSIRMASTVHPDSHNPGIIPVVITTKASPKPTTTASMETWMPSSLSSRSRLRPSKQSTGSLFLGSLKSSGISTAPSPPSSVV